jgi:hypothetical protein
VCPTRRVITRAKIIDFREKPITHRRRSLLTDIALGVRWCRAMPPRSPSGQRAIELKLEALGAALAGLEDENASLRFTAAIPAKTTNASATASTELLESGSEARWRTCGAAREAMVKTPRRLMRMA